MDDSAYTVGIVVDPDFGERLRAVAERIHTWIVDTPVNRSVAEAIWHAASGRHDLQCGVTIFEGMPGTSPAERCRGMLPVVEQHHGRDSRVPPVSALEIYGTELTPELLIELAGMGLVEVTPMPNGWRVSARLTGERASRPVQD